MKHGIVIYVAYIVRQDATMLLPTGESNSAVLHTFAITMYSWDIVNFSTADALTSEDLKELKHNISFAGSGVSVHVPSRALDWLMTNNDHEHLKILRKAVGSLGGPFPYLLPNFTDALALYAESGFEAEDSEETCIVQTLADESGFPFIICVKVDEPDLDSE